MDARDKPGHDDNEKADLMDSLTPDLRDIDPTIIQDMRYAGAEQFRRPSAQGVSSR